MASGSRHRPSAKARRSAARLSAVQALYQIMLISAPVERVISEFVHFRFGAVVDGDEYVSPDPQLFADIVRGTAQNAGDMDAMVAGAMDHAWSLDRVELLLKVILKAGVWELLENPLVPAGIIITEYVNVAHAFFGGKEPAMINAVLDRLARSIRSGGDSESEAAAPVAADVYQDNAPADTPDVDAGPSDAEINADQSNRGDESGPGDGRAE